MVIRMARRVIQNASSLIQLRILQPESVSVHSRHSISQARFGLPAMHNNLRLDHIPYVLITPARNEENINRKNSFDP